MMIHCLDIDEEVIICFHNNELHIGISGKNYLKNNIFKEINEDDLCSEIRERVDLIIDIINELNICTDV